MRLSNRAKKRMIDKFNYCKAINLSSELTSQKIEKQLIKEVNNSIGLTPKKLVSHSFVKVPPRAKVTQSNKLSYYAKGDYYYSDLNCIFKRA